MKKLRLFEKTRKEIKERLEESEAKKIFKNGRKTIQKKETSMERKRLFREIQKERKVEYKQRNIVDQGKARIEEKKEQKRQKKEKKK